MYGYAMVDTIKRVGAIRVSANRTAMLRDANGERGQKPQWSVFRGEPAGTGGRYVLPLQHWILCAEIAAISKPLIYPRLPPATRELAEIGADRN
jgi:hypothetical protein